jgi:hypothetical protein
MNIIQVLMNIFSFYFQPLGMIMNFFNMSRGKFESFFHGSLVIRQ